MTLLRNINANLNVRDQLDASGSLRVSSKKKQVSVKQFRDNQPLFMDRVNLNGATQVYNQLNGATEMSVPAVAGAKAIAQSRQWGNYLTGNSQKHETTAYNMQLQAGVIKRMGYFSSSIISPYNTNLDGAYFEVDGDAGVNRIVIVKNGVVIETVNQSNWNVDTLSGYDFQNFSVFAGDFLYLGGTAWALGFKTGRDFTICHIYEHVGNFAGTMVVSPNQPLRWEIISTGGAGSMQQVCGDVVSEGGEPEDGTNTTFENLDFQANTAGTEYAVIGIKLKNAYRNTRVLLENISVFTQNNDDCIWRVRFNPIVSGIINFVDEPNSSLQAHLGATTNVVTGVGEKFLGGGTIQGNNQLDRTLESALKLGSKIDGTLDEIYLTNEPITNGLDSFNHLTVQEFI